MHVDSKLFRHILLIQLYNIFHTHSKPQNENQEDIKRTGVFGNACGFFDRFIVIVTCVKWVSEREKNVCKVSALSNSKMYACRVPNFDNEAINRKLKQQPKFWTACFWVRFYHRRTEKKIMETKRDNKILISSIKVDFSFDRNASFSLSFHLFGCSACSRQLINWIKLADKRIDIEIFR